jgi:hypothetical protein
LAIGAIGAAIGAPRVPGGVVLAVRVGRPRPFWGGFGLAVLTFGVYSYYWDFKTQDELYKQFELAREGRDQGAVWYVMGFVLPVLRFVYFAHYVGNLRYLRARFGFRRSLSLRAFLGLAVPAAAGFFLGVLGGLALVLGSLLTLPGGLLLYVALYAVAYFRLQRDVNEVWAAYDARAAALRSGAALGGWVPAGVAAAAPSAIAPAAGPSGAPAAPPRWPPPPAP